MKTQQIFKRLGELLEGVPTEKRVTLEINVAHEGEGPITKRVAASKEPEGFRVNSPFAVGAGARWFTISESKITYHPVGCGSPSWPVPPADREATSEEIADLSAIFCEKEVKRF